MYKVYLEKNREINETGKKSHANKTEKKRSN